MEKLKKKWFRGSLAVAALSIATVLVPVIASGAETTAQATSRLGGADRYATAAQIADTGWTGQSDYAVLSAGMDENLVDALAAVPLAKLKNAPILLTTGDSLNAYAEQELTRLGVKTVYVTSGTGVIKQPVLDKLSSLGLTVKALGGSDRFATAVNIAKELPTPHEIVVTTAWTNADALSVASIAAAKGMPILLSDVDSLSDSTTSYIDTIKSGIKTSYVLGGTGVVSDSVKAGLPNAQRVGGADRFATNREVLKNFASDIKHGKLYLANGQDAHIVDSLTGSPLAAATLSPVVLTDTSLPAETAEYIKLNYLPNNVIALGGETVVNQADLDSLTAFETYSVDGAQLGSSNAAAPEEIKGNIKITGNNVTLANVQADYSIYFTGNNVTLNNVTVKGTVFIDPGKDGNATIKNVHAGNVVVMSGANHSVVIEGSTIDGQLIVRTDDGTQVVATETKVTGGTVVTTYAVLNSDGSMGQVVVTGDKVELKGTFTDPVVVKGEATVTAAAGAVVNSLVVDTASSTQQVTLDGNFKAVETKSANTVNLTPTTKIDVVTSTAPAVINVPVGATITTLDAGTSGTLVGGGGQVNGQQTSSTPSTPPPTSTTQTAGGGGSVTSVTVSSVTAKYNNGSQDVNLSPTSGANSYTFDFSSLPDSNKLKGLNLSTNASAPQLIVSSITARDAEWLDGNITANVASNGTVTIGDLIGGLDNNNDGITLGNLRMVFGDSVVLVGKLKKSGYSDSNNITVTITLGTNPNVTTISNTWMTINKTSDKTVQVIVKPGQGNVTLGTITSGGNFNFAQVIAALAIGEVQYTGGVSDAQQLKDAIGIATDAVFDAVKLSQLVGKTIKFGGVTHDEYTVTFTQG